MKRKLAILGIAGISLMGSLSVQAQKTEKLFNGKDLSNWEFLVDKNSVPAEQVYSVKDGMICMLNGDGPTAKKPTAVSSC